MREAIADAAFRHHEEVLAGEREVVGVNVLREDDEPPIEIHRIDPRIETDQVARLRRAPRAGATRRPVEARLADVRDAARGDAQPAAADARGAAGPRDGGRGLRRAAGGVRRVRPGAGGPVTRS